MSTHAPTTGTGIEIDWEKLADASGLTDVMGAFRPGGNLIVARAAIAAYEQQLRDQGFVVVRADDAERACRWYGAATWNHVTKHGDKDARDRLAALVAAPGDEGASDE